MLAEYCRRGIKVSLSDLVEQALRRLWSDGFLDHVPGLRKCLHCPKRLHASPTLVGGRL